MNENGIHKVIGVRHLTDSCYILKLERNNLHFIPGQVILLGENKEQDSRPYSIYSSIHDDFIEVLIKEIENGVLSPKLKGLQPGDLITISPPHGYFTIDPTDIPEKEYLFIATGTGIGPFHCFVKSYPDIRYRLIHGVKYSHEAYEKFEYKQDCYILCNSREKMGDFNGRVTDYLKNIAINPDAFYYLCGSYSMIDDVFDLLSEKGIPKSKIKTEGYY